MIFEAFRKAKVASKQVAINFAEQGGKMMLEKLKSMGLRGGPLLDRLWKMRKDKRVMEAFSEVLYCDFLLEGPEHGIDHLDPSIIPCLRQLVEARDDRQLSRLHQHYQRVPLLILDELGFVPLDKTEGELLFNLLSDRYERCSTIVTSNLAFGEWVQVFGSEKLTTALLDRLAHHAHVLTTKGKSYRTNKTRQTTK